MFGCVGQLGRVRRKVWSGEVLGGEQRLDIGRVVHNIQRKSENVGRKEGLILVAIGDDAHGCAGVLSWACKVRRCYLGYELFT